MKKPIDSDDISRIVTLTYGTMDHGGPYWCYLAVRPSRYSEFKAAMDSKRYNIQNFDKDGFGEVIVSGEGVMPPKDITLKVAEMFNIPVKELFADVAHEEQIETIIDKVNNEAG
jgi:hypothetical protein